MDEPRSPGELVGAATRDLSALVRGEVELARAELAAERRNAARGTALLGTAGALAVTGAGAAFVAGALGLAALGVAPGFAFLAVAGCCVVVGGALATLGVVQFSLSNRLRRTNRTLADSLRWLAHPRQAPDPELEQLRARYR